MSVFTIRSWFNTSEVWFGEFKSPKAIHDYLLRNGWVPVRDEKPEVMSGYSKVINGVETSVCIGRLTRHFDLKEFKRLTKGTRKG